MKFSSLDVLVVTSGFVSSLVGAVTCMGLDFAESLPLLLEGVKASTAGLSLDFNLLGVSELAARALMLGSETDEVVIAVASARLDTVELDQWEFPEM